MRSRKKIQVMLVTRCGCSRLIDYEAQTPGPKIVIPLTSRVNLNQGELFEEGLTYEQPARREFELRETIEVDPDLLIVTYREVE